MKLRKIELYGFKSFRSRTGLEIADGITAVVGPNGCGKSNVVDAVRWALGSQSPKELRGSSMGDVIFAGSEKHRPQGYAEASLTFDNEETAARLAEEARARGEAVKQDGDGDDTDGADSQSESDPDAGDERDAAEGMTETAPEDEVADDGLPDIAAVRPEAGVVTAWLRAPEITVTRRLYRTGDSEYEINGSKCRLRDIQGLFLGTGVGTRDSYAVIEQGRVDFIVSAKPDERRMVIEEAAGITRYKYQRRTAERRLERTTDNLQRVEDIIREVERQVGSLQRQARKARRWRELSERAEKLELAAIVDRYEKASANQTLAKNELGAAQAEFQKSKTNLAEREEALEKARRVAASMDERIRSLTEEVFRVRSKADLLRNSIEHRSAERERITDRERVIESERERIAQELEQLEQRQLSLDETDAEERKKVRAAEELVTRLDRAHTDADHERLTAATRVQELDRALAELQAGVASLKARIQASERERERIESQIERRQRQAEERKERVEALEKELSEASATAVRAEKERDSLAEKLRGQTERDEAVQARRAEAEAEWNEAREAVDAAASRVRGLDAVFSRGDAFELGVKHLRGAYERDELAVEPVTLFECLRTEEQHLDRVAAALGAWLGAVVAPSTEAAAAIVAFALDEELTVTVVGSEELVEGELIEGCVATRPVPRFIRERLRASVVVDDAFGAADTTTDGVAIDPRGVVSERRGVWRVVGAEEQAAKAALTLVREREEAASELESAKERLQETEAALEEAREEAAASTRRRRELAERVEDAQRAAKEARWRRDRVQESLVSARSEAEAAREDVAEQRKSAESLHQDVRELSDEARERRARLEERRSARSAAETSLDAADERWRDIRRELDEGRLALATEKERLRQQESERQQLNQRKTALVARQRELAQELAELRGRDESLARQLESDRERLAQSEEGHDDRGEALRKATADHERVKREATEHEAQRAVERRRAEAAAQKLRAAELAAERAAVELEHVESTIQERFHRSPMAAKHAARGIAFGDVEREELIELRAKLDRLGTVNPDAEEEYEAVKERYDYLTGQKADLETAMDDLQRAIRKMDRTSKQLFEETFHEVDTRFQALFPRLFRGGRAKLELTDPDDLLTTGVDISAQPPGKRAQNINLLSGGEKALTAIALIFAIFQRKPSPFCVLDEVDAPLDDANVVRFSRLVQEMSDESQFLVITHNKRTMEAASTLYGVTMEEPGVSKVVGVTLDEAEL